MGKLLLALSSVRAAESVLRWFLLNPQRPGRGFLLPPTSFASRVTVFSAVVISGRLAKIVSYLK
jgi:hypothetical protein